MEQLPGQIDDRDIANLSTEEKLRVISAPQLSGLDREKSGLPEGMNEGIERTREVPMPKEKIEDIADKPKDADVQEDVKQGEGEESKKSDVLSDISERMVEITNINPKVTEKELCQLFECCGEIVECELISNEPTGRFIPDEGTQTARLTFATHEAADVAELLSGALLGGQSVRVQRIHDLPAKDSHEGEHPTERQWGVIRKLGDLTGRGYVIGQKAINYLVWFDDRYNISKSLGEKAHQLDEKTGISASLSSVIASAKGSWRDVEEQHPNVVKAEELLSSGLSVAGEKVSATAEMLKHTVIAERSSEVLGEFTSAVHEKIGANVGDQQAKEELPKEQQSKEQLPKEKLVGEEKEDVKSSERAGQQMAIDQSGEEIPEVQKRNQESVSRHSEMLGQDSGRQGGL